MLAFLFPIAVYCLILASINRRSRPLFVSGMWDAVGLLFAVAGFFLATVPMLITEFYRRVYTSEGPDKFFALWLLHWAAWLIYYLLLFSGSALMILWRFNKTSIYNVDPEHFPRALEQTCAAIGLNMAANKERIVFAPGPLPQEADSTAIMESAPKPAFDPNDRRHAELEVESFPSACHLTLHWVSDTPDVRRQIEAELAKSLESAAPLENPAAGWLLNISGMIFGALLMISMATVALIVLNWK